GDARHQFDRERCDAGGSKILHGGKRAKRTMKANDRLMAAIEGKIVLTGDIVGSVTENLHNDISGLENLRARGGELGAFLHIVGVAITGTCPRPRFHHHLESCLDQTGHNHRNQRHAALTGKTFFGNTDDHSKSPFGWMTPWPLTNRRLIGMMDGSTDPLP